MGECLITRRGGDPLSFKVVGGASQPSNAEENTIWVNTDTPITSWDFSASEAHRRSGSRNLIVYPYYHTTRVANGVEFTDNGDGTITVNGTASSGADAYFVIAAEGIPQKEFILTPGTYTLSGGVGDDTTNKCSLSVYTSADDWATTSGRYRASETPRTFTIDQTVKARAFIQVYGGVTLVNQVFKPQLEKGSATTSFIKGDATGQAWIKTADNGLRQFNALKKNGVILRPVSAKQYLNGAWISKPVKLYQNRAWQELAQYLYKNGEQYTSLTGGWGLGSGTVSGGKGGFAANADHLSFTGEADTYYGFGTTLKAVDLTNFSTLHVYGDGGGTFGVGTAQDGNFNASASVGSTLQNYSVDISGLSGSHYVKFKIGGSSTLRAYEVWLE